MNKAEQLSYLNGLHDLMNNIETNAGIGRPKWITAEYERVYTEFKQTVEKENEARNRNDDSGRSQDGTGVSPSNPGLRGQDRTGTKSEGMESTTGTGSRLQRP